MDQNSEDLTETPVKCVKNSHVFVTHVANSNEFFTGVSNTCKFFTRLKLDICEKLVPIKISKLVVRIFHTYQNVTYSCEYFTACEIYGVNIKVQQSIKPLDNPGKVWPRMR